MIVHRDGTSKTYKVTGLRKRQTPFPVPGFQLLASKGKKSEASAKTDEKESSSVKPQKVEKFGVGLPVQVKHDKTDDAKNEAPATPPPQPKKITIKPRSLGQMFLEEAFGESIADQPKEDKKDVVVANVVKPKEEKKPEAVTSVVPG